MASDSPITKSAPSSTAPPAPASSSMARRLWSDVVSQYLGQLVLAFFFMIGLAAAEAGFIQVSRWIFAGFDPSSAEGMGATPADVMRYGPWLVLGLGVAQAVFFYLQSVTAQDVAIRTLRDVQNAMFRKIGTFDLAQTQDDGSGQLVSRFTNDMTILRESLTRAPNGVRDIVRLIGLLVMLALQDWVLLISVLLIYPIVGVPVTWLGSQVRRLGRSVQQQIGEVTGFLTESLRGQRMVKTYGLEGYEQERANNAFETRYQLLKRLVRIRSANEPIITVIGAIAIACIIAIAAYRIESGLLTGPELVAFLIGMGMLSQPARGLGTLNAVVQEGFAALERVYSVLDRTPTIIDADGAQPLNLADQSPPPVEFRNINFSYEAGQPILHDLSLTVEAGKTVALVGPSGAGKSSLFGLVPRLYDPEGGDVLIAGQSVRATNLASVREQIALVSQDAILFDDTVEANIRFGRLDATDAEVEEAARRAAAHDFIVDLSGGYQMRVGEGGEALSGGQKQRIALARAFLKDAPILLLDEATAALDAESEKAVEEALKLLSAHRTTLVIAHRLSTIVGADMICVMDQGRLVETGTHEELVQQGGLYARLVELQFGEGASDL